MELFSTFWTYVTTSVKLPVNIEYNSRNVSNANMGKASMNLSFLYLLPRHRKVFFRGIWEDGKDGEELRCQLCDV